MVEITENRLANATVNYNACCNGWNSAWRWANSRFEWSGSQLDWVRQGAKMVKQYNQHVTVAVAMRGEPTVFRPSETEAIGRIGIVKQNGLYRRV